MQGNTIYSPKAMGKVGKIHGSRYGKEKTHQNERRIRQTKKRTLESQA